MLDLLPVSRGSNAHNGATAPVRRPPAEEFAREPWLWDVFGDPATRSSSRSGAGDPTHVSHSEDGHRDGDEDLGAGDVDVEDVYDQLWRHRADIGVDESASETILLGCVGRCVDGGAQRRRIRRLQGVRQDCGVASFCDSVCSSAVRVVRPCEVRRGNSDHVGNILV